ncbi:MAG TPA: hypothetical protein VFZ66_23805 [Herpetosiphonaceae bacterium]
MEQAPNQSIPYAIYEYATNRQFFNVYSYLQIDQLKLEIVDYNREQRRHVRSAVCWLDVGRAKLLVHRALSGRAIGWKFESFGGSERDGAIESRIFRFEHDTVNGQFAKFPYRLTIETGQGKRTVTGGYSPVGKPHTQVSIRLPEEDLEIICLEIRDYLQAHQFRVERVRRGAQRQAYEERQAARDTTDDLPRPASPARQAGAYRS